ncbi:glutamate formimidoyltransferase [Cuniculiplasma sp. SKW3]|uniref:glutamate formimidoyltransferase n=1 Tax=unclassified Cuniculiplasma TaxID=2619706 RepID=UPI003FD30B66
MMKIVECVPNFSEGKDREKVEMIIKEISSVEGVKILDSEMDPNHNRSVVTFICDPSLAVEAAFRGIKKASELIDMNTHKGEHPRFGAADVIPFIPVSEMTIDECNQLAVNLGERVGKDLGIPVFLYGEAARSEFRKNLENIRNKNFQFEQIREHIKEEKYKPDFGPSEVGSAGASIIGSRDFLIAFNVNLRTEDIGIGKKIAKALRAKDGGLAFVKALAFYLDDKKCVQISMNLTSFRRTPVYRAYEMVKMEASSYGIDVIESEVVGLIPMDALIDSMKFYMRAHSFKSDQIFERKVWE